MRQNRSISLLHYSPFKNFMKYRYLSIFFSINLCSLIWSFSLQAQENTPIIFDFEQNLQGQKQEFLGEGYSFGVGMEGEALVLNGGYTYPQLRLEDLSFYGDQDFTIQCWIKTSSSKPMVFLAQKDFDNKGILAQKNAGWALYSSGGTLGWSIGSGSRRINYERENGDKLPISDGIWHQLTLTYHKATTEFRLYYDGQNIAIYKVGFDYSNNQALTIGTTSRDFKYDQHYSPEIETGKQQLQLLVDAFDELGIGALQDDEFIDFIVDPEELAERKIKEGPSLKQLEKDKFRILLEQRKKLISNPYTVFQNKALTLLKPISKLYALQAGNIVIEDAIAKQFTAQERLYPADFSIDKLSIWEETLSASAILDSYQKIRSTKASKLKKKQKNLTIGVWNIWHGGIHWTNEKEGWDSRLRIVEMLREKKVDVVLMQETYSSGDFIAAELGYYFATTSDWDYRSQGSNISVISRYPIEEIQVNTETEFNNVAVKVAISQTQKIWAMSNWYGMQQFPTVFGFHKSHFAEADQVPVFFGGDFNAVPHTDGGDSPASRTLLEAGFTDAFRSQKPDLKKYPGYTHRSGSRIDQLYYKGSTLKNLSTEVISSWPSGFPSDHYLILSKFRIKK